jgi:prepilin-type N-terminal cleavage/methylation domain-containing protein
MIMLNIGINFMTYSSYKLRQKGFTLIELMLSMALFSMVLVIILGAFTQINGSFYRATASTKAQEAVRRLSDEIAETVRTNSVSLPVLRNIPNTSTGENIVQICSDKTSIYIRENYVLSSESKVAVRLLGTTCNPLLDYDGALGVLKTSGDATSSLVGGNVSVHGAFLSNGVLSINTLYGDLAQAKTPAEPNGLFEYEAKPIGSGDTKQIPRCLGGLSKGYQFCATSQMTTVLHNRLK